MTLKSLPTFTVLQSTTDPTTSQNVVYTGHTLRIGPTIQQNNPIWKWSHQSDNDDTTNWMSMFETMQVDVKDIVNYKSAKDIERKGIFVPGRLYKFADDNVLSKYKKDDFTFNRWLVPVAEGKNALDDIPHFKGMVEIDIAPGLTPYDVLDKNEPERVFVCLKTALIPDCYQCFIDFKGTSYFLNRRWRTWFLYNEHVYSYDWFESPLTAGHWSREQWNAQQSPNGNTTLSLTGNAYGFHEKWHDAKVLVEVKVKRQNKRKTT